MANAIEVDFSLPGERVVELLNRIARERGYPDILVVDNVLCREDLAFNGHGASSDRMPC